MQRQLEATDRPWVKIMDIKPIKELEVESDLTDRNSNGAKFLTTMIHIPVKNVGHSIANNVTIRWIMTFDEDEEKLERKQTDVCVGKIPSMPTNSLSLFPDEDSGTIFLPLRLGKNARTHHRPRQN